MSQENETTLSILMDENTIANLERAASAMERAGKAMELASKSASHSSDFYEHGGRPASGLLSRTGRPSTGFAEQGGRAGHHDGLNARDVVSGRSLVNQIHGGGQHGATKQDGPTTAERMLSGLQAAERRMSDHGDTGQLFAVFSRAMANTASSMEKLNDSTLTAGQRIQGFAESLPVVGQLARGLRELGNAVTGTTDALHRQAQSADRIAANMAAVHATEGQKIGMNIEGAGRLGRASVAATMAGRGFAGLGVADLADRNNPMMFGSWVRQIDISRQEQGARLGLAEAQARHDAAVREQEKALTGRDKVRGEFDKADKRFQAAEAAGRGWSWLSVTGGTKTEIDEAGRARKQASDDLIAKEQHLQEATRARQESALEMERKRGEIIQSNISREQERLGILQQQEGLVRAQTQAFGGALKPQRQMAVSFLRQAEQKGWGSLMPSQLDMISRMGGGQRVQRELERRGEADPLTGEFRRLLGEGGNMPQGLSENLESQDKSRRSIAEMQMNLEASTTKAFAEKFDKFIDTLLKSMDRVVQEKAKELETRQRLGNNSRGN